MLLGRSLAAGCWLLVLVRRHIVCAGSPAAAPARPVAPAVPFGAYAPAAAAPALAITAVLSQESVSLGWKQTALRMDHDHTSIKLVN
jgi:hypothetical protein